MTDTTTTGLPLDWNDWRLMWARWYSTHQSDLKPTRRRFLGKNFLADDILGTWNVNGRVVELSEMTFPNLTERDNHGRLLHHDVRGIGLTFEDGGTVVHSFAALERELGIGEES